MTVSSITLGTGNDTSAPNGTKVPGVTSNQGLVSGIQLGYVDGSSDFQPLGDASGIPVQGSTTLSGVTVSSASATVNVGDETTSTLVIASNASRKGWSLTNMSSAVCYVKLGSGASATSFHKRLAQYESCGQGLFDGLYTGDIYALWASNAGGTIVGGDW